MDTEIIKAYYNARGLQWADQKSALLFFLSEVGELAEAYAEVEGSGLSSEERALLTRFATLGSEADEIVSRKPGWIRNNDRLRKQNIAHEAADCNMMLSVFMESYANISPDYALREKMALKLGCKAQELDAFLGIS
jgi:NTP pyrophosphatase (non-canonical NTP hydrolase)